MAIDCQQVSTRMMDLLYGELSGEERATVEAHLAGCASCRAELAAFQGTRAAARRALAADAPPARAHDAILRAAAAAVAEKQAQPVAARPAPAQPSFWERLRARWTLPTFATVGAVAVVVLASKVFLEPDKTVELGRQAVQSRPAEAPSAPPPAGGAPAPAERPSEEAQEREKNVIRAEAKELAKVRSERPSAAAEAAHRATAPSGLSQRGDLPAEGFGALGGMAKGKGPAKASRARAASDDPLDNLLDGLAGSPARDKSAAAPKPAAREFAPPPPPRAQPPSAPAAASAGQKRALDDEAEMDTGSAPGRAGGGHLQGGAGSAAPSAHVAAKAKKVSAPGDDFAGAPAASASAPAPRPTSPPAPAAAREEAKEARRSDAKAESKPEGESPVARADRLYAEGRWAEAVRAYRELLRRDPRNGDAPRWRQRLATAEAQIAPEAPAAATAPAQ
jgi:hypothetical protein